MNNRKVYKIIGLVILVPVALLLLFIAFIWGSIEWNKYSKKRDAIIYQREVCDTIKSIHGQFEMKLNGFSKEDLSKIHFYVKKNHSISRDTVINFKPIDHDETQTVLMPFKQLDIKSMYHELCQSVKPLNTIFDENGRRI